MKKLLLFSFFLQSLVILCGCGGREEIHGNLDSRQSIEVMVALSRAGISVEREKVSSGRKERYSITVAARDTRRAFAVLYEYGLPRPGARDLETYTRPQGLVPNSREMSLLRFDSALGIELERLLNSLPGVVDVKVLVRSHLKSLANSRGDGQPPGASVVIRFVSSTGEPAFRVSQVKSIVAEAVPGLKADSVTVETSRVLIPGSQTLFGNSDSAASTGLGTSSVEPLTQLNPLLKFRVPEKDKVKALKHVIIYLLAFCFAGGTLGFVAGGHFTRKRLIKKGRRSGGNAKNKSFFLEASFGPEGSVGDTGTVAITGDQPKGM